ncbi:hypothetical protein C0J52_21612, partial [Blattella germanica]
IDIKLRRLEWLGHITRIQNNRTSKALLDALSVRRRKVGQPKLRWLDDVQGDPTKAGIKIWRLGEFDRMNLMDDKARL